MLKYLHGSGEKQQNTGDYGDFLFQFHMMTMFLKDKITGYAYICVITVITIR